MSEYIEREAVLAEADYDGNFVLVVPAKKIRNIPAADVVEVVRCEECRWSAEDGFFCCGHGLMPGHCTLPNEYCAEGERRTGNAKNH